MLSIRLCGKFLVERLPALGATAGLACGALDRLHGTLDSK
jgi:hypothetical protein